MRQFLVALFLLLSCSVAPAQIIQHHDMLNGYEPNEHIDWTVTGAESLYAGRIPWASPGAIGSTTPSSGAFTTLTTTGILTTNAAAKHYVGDNGMGFGVYNSDRANVNTAYFGHDATGHGLFAVKDNTGSSKVYLAANSSLDSYISSGGDFLIKADSAKLGLGAAGASDLALWYDGSTGQIDSTGGLLVNDNLGIGATPTGNALTINGGSAGTTTDIGIYESGGTGIFEAGHSYYFRIDDDNNTTGSAYFAVMPDGGSDPVFKVIEDGSAYIDGRLELMGGITIDGGTDVAQSALSIFESSGWSVVETGHSFFVDIDDDNNTTSAYFAIRCNNHASVLFRVNESGDAMLGTQTAPSANGGKCLVLGDNGADPTLGVDTAGIYGKDVSGTVEMFAVDEAGNNTQLSSHDPETGEWIFYSKNTVTGREMRVDMEDLVRDVQQLTGKTYLYESAPLEASQ